MLVRNVIMAACVLTLMACANAAPSTETDTEASEQKAKSMFRTLNEKVSVSPQITLEDVETAKAEGVTLIVNNRPDGEDPGAPQSADIEAAAKAAGIDYVAIPITHSGFSAPQVEAMIDALEGAEGKTLAYCRSGTRSTLLWSLAKAKTGMSAGEIARLAGNAGYDITPVRAMVEAFAAAGE